MTERGVGGLTHEKGTFRSCVTGGRSKLSGGSGPLKSSETGNWHFVHSSCPAAPHKTQRAGMEPAWSRPQRTLGRVEGVSEDGRAARGSRQPRPAPGKIPSSTRLPRLWVVRTGGPRCHRATKSTRTHVSKVENFLNNFNFLLKYFKFFI